MTRIKLTYFQNQFASAFKKGIIELANNEPLQLENLPLDAQRHFYNNNFDCSLTDASTQKSTTHKWK